MSRVSLSHVAVVVLAAANGIPGLIFAADPAPPAPPPAASRSAGDSRPEGPRERERQVFVLNYTPAHDLANTLTRHYQDSRDVRVVADALSNSLLITAPAAELEEIRNIINVLDLRPKSVVVEATLIECAPAVDSTTSVKSLNERDFNGPAAEVAAKVEAEVKAGRIKSVRKLRLRTINNQLSQVNSNEGQGNLAGALAGGSAKPASRQIGQGLAGTALSVTPRIADDDQIVMELAVVDSRPRTNDELKELGEVRTLLHEQVSDLAMTTRALTTVTIKSGEAILVHAGTTNSTSQPSQVLVIVSAEVVREK